MRGFAIVARNAETKCSDARKFRSEIQRCVVVVHADMTDKDYEMITEAELERFCEIEEAESKLTKEEKEEILFIKFGGYADNQQEG